jgi:hypothetical protein
MVIGSSTTTASGSRRAPPAVTVVTMILSLRPRAAMGANGIGYLPDRAAGG